MMTPEEIIARLRERPGEWHRAAAFATGDEAREVGRVLARLHREGRIERAYIPPHTAGWAYRVR